jgi:ferredoxin
MPERLMSALCSRCGNCISACRPGILKPDLGSSGILGLLTPVVRFADSYCLETCNACMQACPTGAIARLPLARKPRTRIGLAAIDPSRCIAFIGEPCSLCVDHCSYKAIERDYSPGFAVPLVKPDLCTGCGRCLLPCPAKGAIQVTGVNRTET